MDAEALRDARQILDTAKPDDLVVVAAFGADGSAAITTLNPDPQLLLNLASSLLFSARGLLKESVDPEDEALRDYIEDALFALPDRFDAGKD
jgi:hypothetical protein